MKCIHTKGPQVEKKTMTLVANLSQNIGKCFIGRQNMQEDLHIFYFIPLLALTIQSSTLLIPKMGYICERQTEEIGTKQITRQLYG
jgi:hypothetical protein